MHLFLRRFLVSFCRLGSSDSMKTEAMPLQTLMEATGGRSLI